MLPVMGGMKRFLYTGIMPMPHEEGLRGVQNSRICGLPALQMQKHRRQWLRKMFFAVSLCLEILSSYAAPRGAHAIFLFVIFIFSYFAAEQRHA